MSPPFLVGGTSACIKRHCIFKPRPRAFHALPRFILQVPNDKGPCGCQVRRTMPKRKPRNPLTNQQTQTADKKKTKKKEIQNATRDGVRGVGDNTFLLKTSSYGVVILSFYIIK